MISNVFFLCGLVGRSEGVVNIKDTRACRGGYIKFIRWLCNRSYSHFHANYIDGVRFYD